MDKDNIIPMASYELNSHQTDLRVLMHTLLEKKKVIFLISGLVCLLSMLYITLKPTKYQTSALLQISHKQQSSLGAITNSTQQNNSNGPEESVSFQIALIRSKFILSSLIKTLNLDIQINPQSGFNIFTKPKQNLTINEFSLPFEYFKKNFLIVVDKANHYQLFGPKKELILEGNVNELIKAKNSFSMQINHIDAPTGSKFYIKKQPETEVINQLRSKLVILDLSGSNEGNTNKAAILQLSLIDTNKHNIVKMVNQLALIIQAKDAERKAIEAKKSLNFLYQQLPILQKSLKEAEEKLNQYRAKSGKIDIKLQTESLFSHLSETNKQIDQTRLKKMELLQNNTTLHPDVIALDQEYNTLLKQRTDILTQLKKLPAADQVALNLSRDVNIKNNLYKILLNKINEQQVINAGIISDIHVLSFASFPEVVSTPNFLLVAIASLLVGGAIGGIIIMIWQIFNRRVNDSDWVEHHFHIENMIMIPYSKNQKLLSQHNQANRSDSPALLAHLYPADIAIEKLQFLRSIIKINLQKSSTNLLTFLSVTKNAGQNFISTNLATLLADEHNKVLLIDADIRHGQMHQYLSNKVTPGLTELIKQEVSIEAAIKHNPLYQNLFFIPRGTSVENASVLLLDQRFKSLLTELSKQYQYIILNSAPALSLVDGSILAGTGGFNVLILAANIHEPWEIDTTIKNIRSTGTKIQGFIFNNIKPGNIFKYHNVDNIYRMRQIYSTLGQSTKSA